MQQLRDWIIEVEKVVDVLKHYQDAKSVQALQDLQEKAREMNVELRNPSAEKSEFVSPRCLCLLTDSPI